MDISIYELAKLYQSGTPWPDIERVAGVGRDTLRMRLTRAGYELAGYQRISEEALAQAAEMRKAGHAWTDVSEKLGRSTSGIRNALRKKGLL